MNAFLLSLETRPMNVTMNYNRDGILVNVFFVIESKADPKATAFLRDKKLPYFLWKRLHLRVYYQRGPESK